MTPSKVPEKLIAANWKMNLSLAEAESFLEELIRCPEVKSAEQSGEVRVLVAPQTAQLGLLAKTCPATTDCPVSLMAQNSHWENSGAFTGETSPALLKELGIGWTLIGHSERRHVFGETDETVQTRVRNALINGLHTMLCVGETLEEREKNQTEEVISRQLLRGLEGVSPEELAEKITLAYEPVWAIGTGKTATVEEAVEAHGILQRLLHERWGEKAAQRVRILYGGSVKPENAGELLRGEGIHGLLVGGASLKIESFRKVIAAGTSPKP